MAALSSSAGWLVGWQGPRQFSPVIPLILVRVLDATGNGTVEFEANSSGTAVQRAHVALAANGQGDAVVVWEAPDANSRGIYARRIVDGVPAPSEEAINLSTDLDEREPSVAIDERGGFVTVWVSAPPPLDPPFEAGPRGQSDHHSGPQEAARRRLRRAATTGWSRPGQRVPGQHLGQRFLDPWVAAEPRGNFVVAWQGVDAVDPQGNGVLLPRLPRRPLRRRLRDREHHALERHRSLRPR